VLASYKITELLRWAHKVESFYFEYKPLGGEEPSDILMFDTAEASDGLDPTAPHVPCWLAPYVCQCSALPPPPPYTACRGCGPLTKLTPRPPPLRVQLCGGEKATFPMHFCGLHRGV
jgi:hypothetical protein